MREAIKIKYIWVEGEEGEQLFLVPKGRNYEDDLLRLTETLNIEMEQKEKRKEYFVNCLPSFFDEVCNSLEGLGYIPFYIHSAEYYCDDNYSGGKRLYRIIRRVKTIRWEELYDND